uniref:Uncharacterized protein n=1 Tax=Pipistrellus kuhlii TaxID=59472 RepID=A0A7J7UA35_PIPKU|nr:hypothetical protein mPipKuh1_009135 [Pipistrellus kuhlii]
MAVPSPGGLSPRQHLQTGLDLSGCCKPPNCTPTISQTAAVHDLPLGHPGIFIASYRWANRGAGMPWPLELCKHWAPLFLSQTPSPFSLGSSFLPQSPNPYFPPRRSRRDRMFLNFKIHSELQVLRGDFFF